MLRIGNHLPLHFAPSQTSSSQNSNVDDTLEGYKIKSALLIKFSWLYLKCRFSKKTNEQICFPILTTVLDRKTNSFVHFLGESAALQFCFEIYWPLEEEVKNSFLCDLRVKFHKSIRVCNFHGAIRPPRPPSWAQDFRQLCPALVRCVYCAELLELGELVGLAPPPLILADQLTHLNLERRLCPPHY